MNPLIHFFTFLLILSAAALIRFWPRTIITKPTDTDTFLHFYLVGLIRKNKHKVPEYLERFTLKARLRKPYLFYWVCSFIPKKYDPLLERLVTTICDCTIIVVIYLLGLYVSNAVFDTPWTPVSLSAIAILAVSPGLLRLGSGPRAFQGTARVFSQTLYVMHIALFYLGVNESSLFLMILSACLGSLVIMSGSFAIQVFLFFGVLICLVNYSYFFVILLSVVLIIVFTKGRIFDILKGRIYHLTFYAKKMQKYKLWGNPKFDKSFKQFLDGWRQAFRQYKEGKGYQVLVDQFLNEQYFLFILFFSFTPLVIEIFLPFTSLPLENIKLLYFISLFSILVGLAIKVKYLLFLGEGERYLEYGLPFATIVLAVVLYHTGFDWIIILILAYSVFLIPFYYSIFFSRYRSIQNDYQNIEMMFQFLNEQPAGNVLSVVSAWIPLYLSNKPLSRSLNFDQNLNSKRDIFYHYGKNRPYISYQIIDMISRYDVKYLFGRKDEFNHYFNKVTKKYKLNFLKVTYETDTMMLFEVREEFQGKLREKDTIKFLKIEQRQLPSNYFSKYRKKINIENDIPEAQVLLSKATLANNQQDWLTALENWRLLECFYPGEHIYAPVKCARALRHMGRIAEAETIIMEEIYKGTALVYAMAEHAELAMARFDWELAISRWNELENDFPKVWKDLPKRLAVCEYNLNVLQFNHFKK